MKLHGHINKAAIQNRKKQGKILFRSSRMSKRRNSHFGYWQKLFL